MTNPLDTTIVVDPNVSLVRIIREFVASRANALRAHTDPELVAQWNGPNETVMRIDRWDCRNGGSYRYLHVIDGEECGFWGCFHEVRSNELIVQTFPSRAWPTVSPSRN